MASKSSHVQDNTIAERRLRPIYEWLDSGINKKALQECDKVLKKTPNLQCAKALKAVALFRLGREVESSALLDALVQECPTEEGTLQAMSLCYRELQQLEKICLVYENALKIDKTNEEIYTHLFMAYVRICDFKAQHQTAMALYKFRPRNPYYCWAVMSLILQAKRGPDSSDAKKRGLLLSLAERMVMKMIKDNKLEAEQEAQLYIMILELQEKHEEILNVFDGPLCDKLINGSLSYTRLPYLVALRRWNEVNLFCKNVLVDNVDKWNIWLEYMKSVFEIMPESLTTPNNSHGDVNENGNSTTDSVDDTPEKAHEFICSLVENSDNGFQLRGPFLARIELCSHLVKKGADTTDLLGEPIELFVEYFRKFGHKPCCVSDLRSYLWLLDSDKKIDLYERLIKDLDIGNEIGSAVSTEQQMQRHICALQLGRLCGVHGTLSVDALKSMAGILAMHYQLGFDKYGQELLSTDQGPSDPYVLLAAHVFYDIAHTTQSSAPLVLAILLLENLLKNTPSSFHAKLLCVKFYHMLGGGVGAQAMYDSLDIKHLQLDSLGYIHCARLPTTGLLSIAATFYDSTLKFFTTNYKDSSDYLTFSYKFGSFVKLDEFMDFREKLNTSIHYTTVAIEKVMCSMLQSHTMESVSLIDFSPRDEINWNNIRDNHDLSVYLSWDPKRIEGPPEEWEETKQLLIQDVNFLKLRVYILWAFSESVSIVTSTDGMRGKHVDSLKNHLNDWEMLHRTVYDASYVPITQKYISLPLPSRLHGFLSAPYLKILTYYFNLFLQLTTDSLENNIVEQLNTSLKEHLLIISKMIQCQKASQDINWERRSAMEYIVNSVEIMSVASLIVLLCNEFLKPTQGKKIKKKMDVKSRELLNSVTTDLQQAVTDFVKELDDWQIPECKLEDISTKIGNLTIERAGQFSVETDLENSHVLALKELKGVLLCKSKMLQGLLS